MSGPYYQHAGVTLWQGHVMDVLRRLADASIHCCVTSPPYWGLRDYGTGTWRNGDPACNHKKVQDTGAAVATSTLGGGKATTGHQQEGYREKCALCGAVRVDKQIGLETTPEEYVQRMVEVFREVRRVLHPTGSLWLNLGDSYASGGRGTSEHHTEKMGQKTGAAQALGPKRAPEGLKSKDLVGIPWRVAFALQADGWWLRVDCIWSKPNPMPESVTDRPTKSHEYMFLLAKSERYFYDAEACAEPAQTWKGAAGTFKRNNSKRQQVIPGQLYGTHRPDRDDTLQTGKRNRRSVWTIPTEPYPEAHFAVFPEALVEPCVLAGTSAKGACSICGAPWERVIERAQCGQRNTNFGPQRQQLHREGASHDLYAPPAQTTGWRPTCKCGLPEFENVPCTVLDPFAGSGTALAVAKRLGRHAVGIELNPDYCQLATKRLEQDVLPLEVLA